MTDCFGIEIDPQEQDNWDKLTAGIIGHPGSHFKGFKVRDPLPAPETCVVSPDWYDYHVPLPAEVFAGATVLEVGCGGGQHAETCVALGVARYIGIDISHWAVECLRRSYARCALVEAYHSGDDRDLLLALRDVDVVYGTDFFIHQPDDRYSAITAFAARVLRPGGYYVAERWMGTMYKVETEQRGEDWRGFQRTRAAEAAVLAACGFEIERYHLTPMKNGLGEDDREICVAVKTGSEA